LVGIVFTIFWIVGDFVGLSHHPPITSINRLPDRTQIRVLIDSRCFEVLMSQDIGHCEHIPRGLDGIGCKCVSGTVKR